jgi:hypothetical protein
MPSQRCRVDLLTDRTVVAREPVAIAVVDPVGQPIAPLAIDWGDGTNGGPNPHTYAEPQHDIRVMISADMPGFGPVFGASSRFNVLPMRVDHEGASLPVYWDFPGDPPSPIPDPVADFTIAPAAPTDATPVTLTSTSTPAEFVEANEWTQIMPPGSTVEGAPVLPLGLLTPGAYVWQLRVRLTDGRWSAPRSRGVQVNPSEVDVEEPPPDPEARGRRARR